MVMSQNKSSQQYGQFYTPNSVVKEIAKMFEQQSHIKLKSVKRKGKK